MLSYWIAGGVELKYFPKSNWAGDLRDASIIRVFGDASGSSLDLDSETRWWCKRIRLDFVDDESIFDIFSRMNASI